MKETLIDIKKLSVTEIKALKCDIMEEFARLEGNIKLLNLELSNRVIEVNKVKDKEEK